MKNFDLTSEEIQELRAAHKAAKKKSASDAYRINAVILLGSDWSLEEVVDALLLDDETLRNYISCYKEGGLERLLEHNHKGGLPKLPIQYFEKLEEELESSIYLTTKDICAYVKEAFNIEYTISGMTALLHRMGYVYKKPKLVPGSADEGAQEIFLGQYLEFMRNNTEKEAVFFVDAVHPTHNTLAGYGWIKKGEGRALKTNSGRSRFNIHGAMNAETFETTIVASEENVNADSTIALFQSLEASYPLASSLYLIVDNARYHFSKSIIEYLKDSRIKLVRLPSYSPELNLIERLWKVLKKKVLYNKHYESFKAFKKALSAFFKNQAEHLDEISSIMGDGLAALA
jgi:transposase